MSPDNFNEQRNNNSRESNYACNRNQWCIYSTAWIAEFVNDRTLIDKEHF